MTAAIFEAIDFASPLAGQTLVSEDHDATAVSGAASVKDAAPTSNEVGSIAFSAETDPEPQPDEDVADIAFVGDQPQAEGEEPGECSVDISMGETLGGGKQSAPRSENPWHGSAAGPLWADEFAFHRSSDEDQRASEAAAEAEAEAKGVEELATIVLVCEFETPEEVAATEAAGNYNDEPSFAGSDVGDTLL